LFNSDARRFCGRAQGSIRMHYFENGAALVIAEDLRSTFGAVDEALVNGSRLFNSIAETARTSRLNATESQRLFDHVAAGLSCVVQGRGEIVDAMKRMTVLKRQSNLETVDIGCDNPLETFTSAEHPVEVRPYAAR
jgi:hypothetical protein